MRTGKVFDFINRYVPVLTGKGGDTKGVFLYGVDNLLPNESIKEINNSGVAKRAIGKVKKYIEADGFSDKISAKLQVNKDQTGDQILAEISSFAAYHKGFTLLIRRSPDGLIKDVQTIEFKSVRKRKDGKLTYNPLLGEDDYKAKETTVHPAYFGVKATPLQMQQISLEKHGTEPNETFDNPEILYVYEKIADNPSYPVPDYVAGLEDIKTAAEFQGLDLETIRNAFMSSGALVTEEIDDVTEDNTATTPAGYFEKMLKTFTGQTKNTKGESGRMKLMWIQVKTMDQAPKWVSFDSLEKIEGTIKKRDAIQRDVCRWVGVHPVLVYFSDAAILGNTQAIANASKELVNEVNPIQRMITNAFEMLYPDKDWTISQFNVWQHFPPEVWAVLTPDEKRNLGGFEALPATETVETDGTD